MLGGCGGAEDDRALRAGGLRSATPAIEEREGVATPGDAEVRRAVSSADDHVHAWSDARLVDAVRREPTDSAALDALVARYWKPLHARCELLTLDRELARDLAQETWLRVLRARASLQPDSNFSGYLMTIATNLCRDRYRSARRAGPLADARLASLDDSMSGDDDDGPLSEALADPESLLPDEQLLLRVDMDRALARLTLRDREVLIARYVDGESAAEIGARHGRTEQTVTSWLRHATQELRAIFGARND